MGRSDSLVRLQLWGAMFVRCQKVRGTVVICTFCRSAQHCPDAPFRSDMAATLARLGVNFGQQRPNFGPTSTHWLQLRPNLAPRRRNLAPNSTYLKATLAQVEVHMASKMGDIAGPKRVFQWYFPRCLLSMTLRLTQCSNMFPMLCLRWAQKLLPKGAKLRHVIDMTRISMCIRGLQFGIHLDRFGPNLSPT